MFLSRQKAGQELAEKIPHLEGEVVVAGLARGGMVVANEVAKHHNWPLDIVLVRKIGAPDNQELAIGAIAEGGEGVYNEDLIALLGVTKAYLTQEAKRQKDWIAKWKKEHLGHGHTTDWADKTVVLVDDGIATGASMEAAIEAARALKAAQVVLAVPVSSIEAINRLTPQVDHVFCLSTPARFQAVGAFYKEFKQTSDSEVISFLEH